MGGFMGGQALECGHGSRVGGHALCMNFNIMTILSKNITNSIFRMGSILPITVLMTITVRNVYNFRKCRVYLENMPKISEAS